VRDRADGALRDQVARVLDGGREAVTEADGR
jgi:hypothetical protein